MNYKELYADLMGGKLDHALSPLYPSADMSLVRERYAKALESFRSLYGEHDSIMLFSTPGRSELSGNHTDHNYGRVIASSIDLDVIAVVTPTDDNVITVKSEGFPEDVVDICNFTQPDKSRFGRSDALIAGVVSGFKNNGRKVGGFKAYTTSNVLKGSGLSSSAAFEDMIGNILNHVYNGGLVDFKEISIISQYSENKFFGKPCGLMDQVACAAGGIVSIDFADPSRPVVKKLDFDMSRAGYCLCITDTGGNHADLTADYAAVPAEMKSVASYFGKTVLRELDKETVIKNAGAIREKLGDRALMRALHFFDENARVDKACRALENGRLDDYFAAVSESGRSSFCYLQNVYTTINVREQGLSLALCLTDGFFKGSDIRGAYRVHGGGFAGTIQAYIPTSNVNDYVLLMDGVFGKNSCHVLHIRSVGAVAIK